MNQKQPETFSDDVLTELSYPLPQELTGDRQEKGIVLSQLLPLFFEAWEINIDGIPLRIETLEDTLEHSYLLTSDPELALFIPGYQIFTDVGSIDVSGEILADDQLEIWISWEGTDELREEILRFGKNHAIDITVLNIPNPESRLISVVRGGGSAPDIIMSSPGKLHSLVEAKALQPLPQSLTIDLDQRGVQAFSLQEKQWALPFYCDSQLFFYNPELIDLSSHDSITLTELETLAAQLSSEVALPLTWNAYSVFWLLPFEYSFGKESLFEDNRDISVFDEPTKRALDYIVELNQKDYFRPTEKDAMISLFSSGRSAMIYSASYSIPYFQKLGIPYEIAPVIINDATSTPLSPMLDFKAFGITHHSSHPILAYRLLSYLTGLDVQYRFSKELYKLPANSFSSKALESSTPYYEVMLKQTEQGKVIPSDSAYTAYKNIMWKLLRFALSGQMKTEEVLKQGERLLEQASSDQ